MKNDKLTETAAAKETALIETTAPDPEELVEYTAPLLGPDGARDLFIAVNGESVRIKRGVRVKLRRKFYEALQNAEHQAYDAWVQREQAAGAAASALAEM